jgi:hypothetical protein
MHIIRVITGTSVGHNQWQCATVQHSPPQSDRTILRKQPATTCRLEHAPPQTHPAYSTGRSRYWGRRQSEEPPSARNARESAVRPTTIPPRSEIRQHDGSSHTAASPIHPIQRRHRAQRRAPSPDQHQHQEPAVIASRPASHSPQTCPHAQRHVQHRHHRFHHAPQQQRTQGTRPHHTRAYAASSPRRPHRGTR